MARQHRVVDQDVEHLTPTRLDGASSGYHLTVPRALLTRIAALTRRDQSGTTHASVVARRRRDDDRILAGPRLRRCRAQPMEGRT
jgi:hypothetical protein